MGPVAGVLIGALAGAPCAYPDEGTMPLRRAVAQVRLHPEVEAWARDRREQGETVHYALLLDEPRWAGGRCYWTVEVRLGDQVHRRFLVSPAGRLKE